jgi:rhodanese-related sulfurtransferase
MSRALVAGLVGLAAVSSGCKAVQTCLGGAEDAAQSATPLQQWTTDQVAEQIGRPGGAKLFDANPREFYDEHHLPTATWVPYDGVTAEVLPADRSTQLVFYCANPQCSASRMAARAAMALGYGSVAVMPDGIFGWLEQGRPTEP